MAISPDLLKVEKALEVVNASLFETYADFGERTGLTSQRIDYLKNHPKPPREVDLDFDGITIPYFISQFGPARTGTLEGAGINILQEGEGNPDDAPLSIAFILDPNDFSKPLSYTYKWDPEHATVTLSRITALNSHVLEISQQTSRDHLFKGPYFPTEFTPAQSIIVSFSWTDQLVGWDAVFRIVGKEHEDDLHYPISNLGSGLYSGDLVKGCLLPETLDMLKVLENMLDSEPATNQAATFFQAT
ncbi:hypothetical protein A3C59_05355 [Candidatus Daviesbacteria bacterium RIFCSPHIGHO2_02_FULL_36_13]|uniref:Uncharacterized protein n=1 Tax=Candidatus Daviesbacteria bacterium RIFCSPHIGHO2_02_FULL_36_13 TaxID=1797768 RepID=A0A1F5JSH0_9BACT|nr:MAG: hypothetical protein A3C59_05355 [Candidatus Daviesbacteria bacterium RIFCSPHIGHO2_02_FULL_36_13]